MSALSSNSGHVRCNSDVPMGLIQINAHPVSSLLKKICLLDLIALWVKRRHLQCKTPCPIPKRCAAHSPMSALCQ